MNVVRLVVVVEYIPDQKQFIFDVVRGLQNDRFNSLQWRTVVGTPSVEGISALAEMQADIILKQVDQFNETVRYRLENLRLFDDLENEIPKEGKFEINEWYYDAPHREFATDHNFQIVVVRSGEEQGYINSFEERMDYLHNPPSDGDGDQSDEM